MKIWIFLISIIHFLIFPFSVSSNTDPTFASLFTEETEEFLPVDQAFVFDFHQRDDVLKLVWTIADGYYVYRDKFKFSAPNVTFGDPIYPNSKIITDEYFGTTHVYYHQATLTLPITSASVASELTIQYQGCATAGLCYPPTKIKIPISPISSVNSEVAALTSNTPTATETSTDSEQIQLANALATSNFLWTLLIFFGLGVGLALTPCVFPMYPILAGIIAGQGKDMSMRRGFTLSLAYVQGMALTYAGLGLVVASFGIQFQAYFQHPIVLVSISLLFIVLAASMFGLFDINLPSSWQEKVTQLSNKQSGGSLLGVFFMGALSGLIASPCTTAPLSGALLYVAQSGDLFLGGITLYILSLGMGIPLIAIGTSGGRLLPKAGQWMNNIKAVFGFILLAVPLILLDRIIPITYTLLFGSALAIALAMYLYYTNLQLSSLKAKTLTWTSAMGLFIAAAFTIHTVLFPQVTTTYAQEQNHTQTGEFIDISSISELNTYLAQAKEQQKPVLIDLYADWCIACKEFEQFTFPDPRVKQSMDEFVLIRFDVTDNTDDDIEMLDSYSVLGLPTLLFFTPESEELSRLRVTGFMGADNFHQHLEKILQI